MVSTLGDEDVAPEFVALVHRHTEGNAFFVQEIVRMLVERGEASRQNGVWECRSDREIAIPRNVQDAIGERLSHLSKLAQELLSEASVLGDSFEFDDLSAMGDRSEEAVEECLEEASRASVIRLGQGDSYAFNHVLTQQLLYRELPPRRRRRLHLAAGRAIEQQPEQIRKQRSAELARHFLEGRLPARALTYSMLAGDQAESRFAHREAERHYRVALDLTLDSNDAPLKATILEKLGWVRRRVVTKGPLATPAVLSLRAEQRVEHRAARPGARRAACRMRVRGGRRAPRRRRRAPGPPWISLRAARCRGRAPARRSSRCRGSSRPWNGAMPRAPRGGSPGRRCRRAQTRPPPPAARRRDGSPAGVVRHDRRDRAEDLVVVHGVARSGGVAHEQRRRDEVALARRRRRPSRRGRARRGRSSPARRAADAVAHVAELLRRGDRAHGDVVARRDRRPWRRARRSTSASRTSASVRAGTKTRRIAVHFWPVFCVMSRTTSRGTGCTCRSPRRRRGRGPRR